MGSDRATLRYATPYPLVEPVRWGMGIRDMGNRDSGVGIFVHCTGQYTFTIAFACSQWMPLPYHGMGCNREMTGSSSLPLATSMCNVSMELTGLC